MSNVNFDVAIFGSGVAGLMSAVKLARLGFHVALVESSTELAAAASTRNVGWVHSGAYHAGSIQERQEAISVAAHCAFGLHQIRTHYPEVVENQGITSHAIVKNPANLDEVTARWKEAGVSARAITVQAATQCYPGSTISDTSAVFEVGDLSINTRMLYQRLIEEARVLGVEILRGTQKLELIDEADASFMRITRSDGTSMVAAARIFIYATGHNTRPLVQQLLGVDLPVRLWKSQMLLVNRLSRNNVFHVDMDEVAIINHRNISIVNLSGDAIPLDYPNYEINSDGVNHILTGLLRFFPDWDGDVLGVTACIKTDVSEDPSRSRSLDVTIGEPKPNHITIMPGKMTEAPYLTDLLCRVVFDRIELGQVARRPIDRLIERIHL